VRSLVGGAPLTHGLVQRTWRSALDGGWVGDLLTEVRAKGLSLDAQVWPALLSWSSAS
jgi:hypothetical protein